MIIDRRSNSYKSVRRAKELAQEIIRVEEKIMRLIKANQLNFDVYYDETMGWIVATSYCQLGGCVVKYISAEDEWAAKKAAAVLTVGGNKPSADDVCTSCREEMYQDQI